MSAPNTYRGSIASPNIKCIWRQPRCSGTT